MSERNISEAERTLGFLLRLPYEQLAERVYGALARHGFTDIRPAHSSVFRYIAKSGSRVSDLAERARMTKQSMSYLVDSLSEGGYVTTVPDPADGRAKLVRLTARGRKVSEALVRLSREQEERFAALLGAEKMRTLRGLLGELAAGLDAPPTGNRSGDAQAP